MSAACELNLTHTNDKWPCDSHQFIPLSISSVSPQQIERATEIRDHNNPDWTLIMEICDAINDTDEG